MSLLAHQREIAPAELQRARERALARALNEFRREADEAVYARAAAERVAPVFSQFTGGTDGELWVELFELDATAPRPNLVLDTTGTPVARTTLPAHFVPHQIGRNYILGVLTDDDDVEHVAMFRLTRR